MVMKTPSKQIEKLIREAKRLAIEHIEQKARQIMRTHPNLKEFVMAMGSATFTANVNGREELLSLDERIYFKSLNDFIEEWDDSIGLLGEPMRFTVDGPIITDW